eukprot:9621030-Alexandrium_andersonii.AAC.1
MQPNMESPPAQCRVSQHGSMRARGLLARARRDVRALFPASCALVQWQIPNLLPVREHAHESELRGLARAEDAPP